MVHRQPYSAPRQGPAGAPRRWILLLLPALVLALAAPALAQSEVDKDSVQRELERTDQIIEKARELASETTVASSHGHLQAAIKWQQQAWKAFKDRPANYRRAYTLTMAARRDALKAMDVTRIEKNAQEGVARAVDQAQDRVLSVGQLVRESGDPLAHQVFDQGIEHLRRARRAITDRRYVQAKRLAMLASSLIDRAARIARGEIAAGAAAEASIERTAALLEQVEAMLGEERQSPGASPLIGEARRLLDSAADHLREGRAGSALRLSLAARQKGLQLLTELNHQPGEQDVLEAIEDLGALFAEMGPEIESSGGEQARRKLAEGQKLLRRARHLLEEGRPRRALQHLLAAERLLKEAAKSAGM